jgi:hypothetical protein
MRRPLVLAILGLCLTPSVARADTVTITGGELTAVGIFGFTTFTLTGDGFSASGGREPGGVGPACAPCVAGDPVTFDSTFAGEFTLGSGPATVNGLSYSRVYYYGDLSFDGETIPFPAGSATIELTSPFVLRSDPANPSFLAGNLDSQFLQPDVFRVMLTGSGVATAVFRQGPGGLFSFDRVTYAFAAPAPVPEPTSIVLAGSGLLAVWRARRRKIQYRGG